MTLILPDAAEAKRVYQRGRRKASIPLYFRDETEKATYQTMAEASGYSSFNPWALQMIANATSGSVYPADYVAGLKRDVEKYRAWLAQKDQEISELRRDLKVSEQQREDLRVVLASVTQDTKTGAAHNSRRGN